MSVLNAETLELIQTTAVNAAGATGKVQVLPQLAGEPKHVYGVVTPDGKLERVVAAAAARSHQLISLEEAILYAVDKGSEEKTVIWFDRSGVEIVLDDETRWDRASLKFNFTPQLKRLLKIEADKETFEQRDFKRLLQIELAGCRRDDKLLNWVSDMRFLSTGETQGRLSHGKESLGRDIEIEASSDMGECPQEVIFDVRVFDDPSLKSKEAHWGVKCAVEILSEQQLFRLTPLPLELHNAIESELFVVGQKIRAGVKCKAFRGRP